jgi:hypothetical protein
MNVHDSLAALKMVSDAAFPPVGRKVLFTFGEALICEVDGEKVRDVYKGFPNYDDPMGFVLGGHHYRYPWIPESEIWIVRQSPLRGKVATGLFHEPSERLAMKYLGLDYDTAHTFVADLAEHVFRMLCPAEVEEFLCQTWEDASAL